MVEWDCPLVVLGSPVPATGLLEVAAAGASRAGVRVTGGHDLAAGCEEAGRWAVGVPPRAYRVFTRLRVSGGSLDPSHAGRDRSCGQDRLEGGVWEEPGEVIAVSQTRSGR